jgi:hypothetical protein
LSDDQVDAIVKEAAALANTPPKLCARIDPIATRGEAGRLFEQALFSRDHRLWTIRQHPCVP